MAKKLTKTVDVESQTVTLEFADGSKISSSLTEFSPEMITRLALHGLSQKKGDACASLDTVAECREAVEGIRSQLLSNDWSAKREGSGSPRIGLLVEALARITGRTIEECTEVVEALDDEQKKLVRADANVRKIMAQIRYERETAKESKGEGQVDLMALLGGAK